MPTNKVVFKGFKQMLKSDFDNIIANNPSSLTGVLTFVRESSVDTLGTIYLGTRKYASGNFLPLSGGVLSGDVSTEDLVPNANNTNDIGTSTNVYKNVYATTLHGNLDWSYVQNGPSLATLDGSAVIASVNNNVITIKAGITETDGVVANNNQSDIVLAEIAVTGLAEDVDATYNGTTNDLQTIITNISTRLNSLEANAKVNSIVCNGVASEIPSGAIYNDGVNPTITGTMEANNSTMGNIYLVKNGSSYVQYITTRTGTEGNYTYSWVSLGSTSVDLSGYINQIIRNNKTYTAPSGSNTITLDDTITNVVGETAIAGGSADYISVSSSVGTASAGNKTATISSLLKTASVSGATSNNNGVAVALDVKNYIQNNLTTINTWTESDIVNS